MTNPRQETLTFEPEYAVSGGIKHEWTGTLFLPTAEESERLEKERATETHVNPVCLAEVKPDIVNPLAKYGFNRTRRVKMKMKDALGLRQRGA